MVNLFLKLRRIKQRNSYVKTIRNVNESEEEDNIDISDGFLPNGWQDNWAVYELKEGESVENDEITLYRGICEDHPCYEKASEGTVIPWGIIDGHTDPIKHNQQTLEIQAKSVFTSWTTDENTAKLFAESGSTGKGIVLVKKFHLSRLVTSQDAYNEKEVLVPGVITDAELHHKFE